MRTHIEPLTQDHLEAALYNGPHAHYVMALGPFRDAVEAGMVRGGGMALMLGDYVLAMAGVNTFWRGVGQLWMRMCLGAE